MTRPADQLADLHSEGAIFSEDRTHRFALFRDLGEGGDGACLFICLNPSTATEVENDPTVRRCINFARSWGYERFYLGNLSSYRSTDPKGLRYSKAWELGDQNLNWIIKLACISDLVVAAWGAHPAWLKKQDKVDRVMINLDVRDCWPRCLGTTRDGHPRHPLYLRKDTAPMEYPHMISR